MTHEISGIGTDIIEVERIQALIEKYGDRFLDRIFLPSERDYCDQFRDAYRRYAARFAAKEALVKALGCGFGKEAEWHDFEILNEESGKPTVNVSDRIKTEFGNPRFLLSMSHCRNYATATAIALSE